MRADHPLIGRATVTATEATSYPWIGVPDGYPFRTFEQRIAAAAGAAPRIAQRLWDNDLIERLVAATDLVALLPRFTSPHGSGVVLRPVAGVDTSRDVVALMQDRNAERRAVRHVIETITSAQRLSG